MTSSTTTNGFAAVTPGTKLLGEILSSQRVHEGGVATSLTSAQWIERWEKFRTKYPQHPSLRIQQKPE